jgi:YVTN family beta-propeller protein
VLRRINLRFVFLLVVLLFAATRQIAREERPSFLRPGLRLHAYVTNSGDGTVTIVDVVSLHARKSVPVGPAPSGIRAHPTRDEIWGVSTAGGYVWVIDARTEEIAARIDVGAQPFAVDFSPDGKRAYVAASGVGSVVGIDCASRQIVVRARVGRRPWLARVTPDGRLLVVPNRDDNSVTLLTAEDLAHVATVPVAPRPEQVVVLRDGTKAFISAAGVGNGSEPGPRGATIHQVSVVDLVKPALLANLPLPATPGDLVLEPKDGKLLVPSPESHGLVIIDTWRNEVEGFLLIGNGPYRATLSEKPETLYVSDVNAGVITPVQFRFRRTAKPIPAGQRPGVCRLTPEKDLLLVVNEDSDDLAVIRTSTHSLITLVPVGSRPSDLAIKVF